MRQDRRPENPQQESRQQRNRRQDNTGTEPPVAALARAAMARGLAGDDPAAGLRWLERAHRLVPTDPNVTLALASACLTRDPARAASLFQDVTDRHDVRQAWLGLAAARLRLAGPEAAEEPFAAVLSRHAFAPDIAGLAETIARRPGGPGWCALRPDGGLEIHPAADQAAGKTLVSLDGKPVRGTTLPAHWQRARIIDVHAGGTALLGSPIQVAAIRRLAGCVEAVDGSIRGWAWHPGDPDTAPALTLSDAAGRAMRRFVATDESIPVPDTGPMARPRSFRLDRPDLPASAGPLHIRGPDGKDLPGSPLHPFADEAAHVAAALRLGRAYPAGPAARTPPPLTGAPSLRANGPVPPRPVGADGRKRAATVVIPVHDGGEVVLACLDSVRAALPAGTKILVVDDGSADPVLVAALDTLTRRRKITLLRHPSPLGFPAAANAGIHASPGQDVVLLNSDTLVPPGWLERLRQAAYADPAIGTVTPLSNDASIVSYPGPAGTNPRPGQAATNQLDRLAQRANGSTVVDIPVGVGFCLYLRRDCLN
ncbi:MAG TPA: glycosyltransferase, partial [Caulobacteraceae bacterium]